MSGRAPGTSVASPIGTSTPGVSPVTGARRMRTLETPLSSSAQPVTAMDPVMPAELLVGVSKLPNGGTVVASGALPETSFDGRLFTPAAVYAWTRK